MATNNKPVTCENMEEWIHSTGFLLPRNDLELIRFEKLYGKCDESLTGREIDPDRILNGQVIIGSTKTVRLKSAEDDVSLVSYRMVARNGNSIPDHIVFKMKKNHQCPPLNDSGSTEESHK